VPDAKRESKFDDGEVRVRYEDGEVRANFDLRSALEDHFAARTRGGGGASGGSLADRKRKLRRLVRLEGMTLDEARELDFDAWADDLPRLRAMRDDYLADPAHRPPIGSVYTKGVVMICAASGHGKGVLVDEIAAQIVALAQLAGGRQWSVAMPAGRNAVEDVKDAEIVITTMRASGFYLRTTSSFGGSTPIARRRRRPATPTLLRPRRGRSCSRLRTRWRSSL